MPYDAAHGPAVYRGREWPVPTRPLVSMTLAEADSLPDYVPLAARSSFRVRGLEATIDPRNLLQDGNGTGYLQRSDIMVLRMIADSWPERPIYISRTTGDYAERMGLGDQVLSQGLARRSSSRQRRPGVDTMHVEGAGWFDLTRSTALWRDTSAGRPRSSRTGSGWTARR